MARQERTRAQIERQDDRHRDNGKYARVNPCYVCEKSAGTNYCSHGDTDYLFGDALLCICDRCAKKLLPYRGADALIKAREIRAKLGLDPQGFCCDDYIETARKRQVEEGL